MTFYRDKKFHKSGNFFTFFRIISTPEPGISFMPSVESAFFESRDQPPVNTPVLPVKGTDYILHPCPLSYTVFRA